MFMVEYFACQYTVLPGSGSLLCHVVRKDSLLGLGPSSVLNDSLICSENSGKTKIAFVRKWKLVYFLYLSHCWETCMLQQHGYSCALQRRICVLVCISCFIFKLVFGSDQIEFGFLFLCLGTSTGHSSPTAVQGIHLPCSSFPSRMSCYLHVQAPWCHLSVLTSMPDISVFAGPDFAWSSTVLFAQLGLLCFEPFPEPD